MVGVPGTAAAIFQTMRDANINVIMISQASSEHSVCFAVKSGDSQKAVDALRRRQALAGAACAQAPVKCALPAAGAGRAGGVGVPTPARNFNDDPPGCCGEGGLARAPGLMIYLHPALAGGRRTEGRAGGMLRL
jgi:hypothetical protein